MSECDVYLRIMKNPLTAVADSVRRAGAEMWRRMSRFVAWQRRGVSAPRLSAETHVCLNCRNEFTGNYCPRCGQSAGVTRFTIKSAMQKVLEVWGLGNRSLPRTLWHLIIRPGYMIGGYLEGRQMPYFPPIKMLFLVTAAYVLTMNIVVPGFFDMSYDIQKEQLAVLQTEPVSGEVAYDGKITVLTGMNLFYDGFQTVLDFFKRNHAIELIFSHSIFALITMAVFRKSPVRPGLNIAECFFSQIFIASQLMIVSLIVVCLDRGRRFADSMYYMPFFMQYLILLYDYKQLYGFKLLRTAWYTAKVFIGWFLFMMAIVVGLMALSVLFVAVGK